MGNLYTDVIMQDPCVSTTEIVSDLALLQPFLLQRVATTIQDAKANGPVLTVFQTDRSAQRGELLFQEGPTQLRNVGIHQYGLTCDLVKSVGGQPSWKSIFRSWAPLPGPTS